MKYLRKFNESKEYIKSICQKYGIKNYTIDDDGSIDVNGNVDLSGRGLTKLPLKFRNVTGDFYCSYNQLTTIEGAPKSVSGKFGCDNNQLVNLDFAPSCQSLSCFDNPIHKWWSKIDISKLDAFIDLGIDSRDPDFMNVEKINLLLE